MSGMDWESAWEASLLDSTAHCEIWGYDHSTKSFGRQISQASFTKKARTHFTSHVQLGPVDRHDRDDDPKLYTLSTLMKSNGHAFIDILKIDIEGAEFDALDAFVDAFIPAPEYEARHPHAPAAELPVLPVGQLQLEIHAWGANGASFKKFRKWWERLENAGLRPFWTEPNLVYVNLVRGARPDLAEVSSRLF